MRKIHILVLLLVVGFFFVSCSDSKKDNGGTTGGSGEVKTAAATDSSTTQEPEQQQAAAEPVEEAAVNPPTQPSSSPNIWLDAFSAWNCTGNWTERDGALGLAAYSGNGSCSTPFPGESGTYQLVLKAQTEFDGSSPYKLSINGNTVSQGQYPLSSSLGCACPLDDWRSVCPDRDQDIDLGTHQLEPGDVLEFWGDDDYPCGEHGSYAKWHGIMANRQ